MKTVNIVEYLSDKMAYGCYSEKKYQLVDITTDIIIWCQENGKDFEEALRMAKSHAETEITENKE